MQPRIVFIILCLMALTTLGLAQEVEFNYNGRVKVEGQAYSGAGHFKFALVDKQGTNVFWANDGVTLDGSQPLSAVTGEVKDGFFSVNIGDTDTTNMAALDASIFNSKERILLRTWFSDSSHGFEQLRPDREVVNPALLGGKSFKQIDLYVDPASGNDSNAGLRADKPKRTIQAAWDALPTMLETTATLHLANGVYREEVLVKGRLALKKAVIQIIGNIASPDSVRVTGADASDENRQVRANGFNICEQKGLVIKGIYFDHQDAGIYLSQYSSAKIMNCKFRQDCVGVDAEYYAYMECFDLDSQSSTPGTNGYKVGGTSTGIFQRCRASGVVYGIYACQLSNVAVFASVIDGCSFGVVASGMSHVTFPSSSIASQLNTFSNCGKGISLWGNSMSIYANRGGINFVSCGQNIDCSPDSVVVQ